MDITTAVDITTMVDITTVMDGTKHVAFSEKAKLDVRPRNGRGFFDGDDKMNRK